MERGVTLEEALDLVKQLSPVDKARHPHRSHLRRGAAREIHPQRAHLHPAPVVGAPPAGGLPRRRLRRADPGADR
jgi:hypothetical protein